jgi:hypothetical protein
MQEQSQPILKERNQLTHRVHRHEVLWQITIPIVVGGLIMLIMMVLAVVAPPGTASQLADISIIHLIVPALIFGVISLLMLVGSIYLTIRMILQLPFVFYRIQSFFWLANERIGGFTDRLVAPILRINSSAAAARAFRRSVFGRTRSR